MCFHGSHEAHPSTLRHKMPLKTVPHPEKPFDPTTFKMPIIDAHTHIFPSGLMKAVRRFFNEHYWPVGEYGNVEFLLENGVNHLVLLQYAHKPGMSVQLNDYMIEQVAKFNANGKRVTGLATVYPGEAGMEEILASAFKRGLAGIKMHTHVQVLQADDPRLMECYKVCQKYGKPALVHTGREPNSVGLKADTYKLCTVDMVDKVCTEFPDLVYVVPHLGMNETREYFNLLEKHKNLYLDTTMCLTPFFSAMNGFQDTNALKPLFIKHRKRILYGSDFPNIPYHYAEELRALYEMKLERDVLEDILYKNACRVYGIELNDKAKL